MSAVAANTDRNLLFGVLALQMGFVSRDALIGAMVGWVGDKRRPLADLLVDRGALDPDDRPPIELAVRRHLAKHGDDASRCLTAPDLGLVGPARELVGRIDDADLRASLADPPTAASSASDATTAYSESPHRPADRGLGPASAGSRFAMVRPHRQGGLGEVFIAWDRELGRQVALKEIRPDHAHDPGLRARFVREAEINGNLEHPGIVPVHGMGTSPDGRPYYAMRFVDGETLQDAVDRFHAADLPAGPSRTLGLRGLLRRFVDVCEAIAYAHSKGVIHRDLKPGNIMLGPFGETLIIDWGLAKVVGRDDSDGPAAPPTERIAPLPADSAQMPTVLGETLGSPPYMSPEQARGCHDELDHRSDVYSLGATLYTVLTGRPPATGKPASILDRVARGAIDPPSVVDPRIPRALDAICRKAMRLEPGDRYRSARDLASDLDRWMAGEAVSAYRDPPSARLFRWARRHKSPVAASLGLMLAALVALAVGLVVVGRQRAEAERARDEAELARLDARQQLKLGIDLIDQLVTFGDRQLIAQQPARDRSRFLETAEDFLRRFHARGPDEPDVRRESGMIARRLANLYRLVGAFDQAEPLYEQSVAILSALAAHSPDPPADADLLAEAIADRADARLTAGRPREADAMLDRALELARGNAPEADPTSIYQRTLARVLGQRGASALALGLDPRARAESSEAIDRIRPLADPALPKIRDEVSSGRYHALTDQLCLISARRDLAEALDRLGEGEEAGRQRRLAFERMGAVAAGLDGLGIPDVDHYLGWLAADLARSLAARGPVGPGDEAMTLLDNAVPRLEALVGRHGDLWQFRTTLALALASRAELHRRAGRPDRARADAEAAVALAEPIADRLVPVADAWIPLADALETLARLGEDGPDADREAALDLMIRAVAARGRALDARPGDRAVRDRLDASRARLDAIRPSP